MKDFALIGAAGYVAPRHMKAIKETGNNLVAALDPKDSVGILDSYFPQADFFVEFERFDRHLDLLRRQNEAVDYVSICSPNYLHDSHIRFAMRNGAHAICEKPLVLNPWNLDALAKIEQESGCGVYTILQLRLHPSIIELRDRIQSSRSDEKIEVELTYVTSRGRWYHVSWKGDDEKSGGIATNIGVHFFDMLHYVFGPIESIELHAASNSTMAGYLELERARVRWFLSIDAANLPEHAVKENKRTYRSILIDNEELEFSSGFADLHTVSYKNILCGDGFGVLDARPAVAAVSELRSMTPVSSKQNLHPLLSSPSNVNTRSFFKHETSIIDDGAVIGDGTKVWHWTHVSADAVIGKGCVLGQNVFIGPGVKIGDRVKIQNNVSVFSGVELEDEVFCGPSMVFTNVNNPRAGIEKKNEFRKTLVRHGATLGANCTVVCGATIGKFAFIAAGAVVVSDVSAYALAMGVPAKHTGWMSRHGERLDLPLQGKVQARCPVTGELYKLGTDGLSAEN